MLIIRPRLKDLQIFDDASRGPLGSVKFLLRVPTKSSLPYMGCIVILAALAIDPMAQQILKFEQRLTQTAGHYSSFRASQVYDFANEGVASQDMSAIRKHMKSIQFAQMLDTDSMLSQSFQEMVRCAAP